MATKAKKKTKIKIEKNEDPQEDTVLMMAQDEDVPEVHRKLEGYIAYRTEWAINGCEESIAGSIDFVAKAADGTFMIVDWKRCKQLKTKYTNPFSGMLPPLSHLPDCAGQHYRLQLNCYRFLLQKYYGMVVSEMLVVCTHPDNQHEAFIDHVPIMTTETDLLMSWQRQQVSSMEDAIPKQCVLHDQKNLWLDVQHCQEHPC